MTVMPRIPHRRSKLRRSSFVAPTDRATTVPDALSWREQTDAAPAPKGPAAWTAASVTASDRTVIDAGPYGVIDLAVMGPEIESHHTLGVVWWDKRSLREEDDDLGAIETSYVPAPMGHHVSLARDSDAAAAERSRAKRQASPVSPAPASIPLASPGQDIREAQHAPPPKQANDHASIPVPADAGATVPARLDPPPGEIPAPPVPANRPGLDEAERGAHARRSRHVALVPHGVRRRDRRPDGRHPRRARLRRRRLRRRLIAGVLLVVVAFAVTILIQSAFVTPFTVPSVSMQNTFDTGDRILVNKLAYGAGAIHRGDVVVFHDPGGWLGGAGARSADDDYLVKRVIGIPGDHVSCCSTNGNVTVNGMELYEPYAVVPAGSPAASRFEVTVPAGELWVLGDNRFNSRDSSQTQNLPSKGFVPIADVVGQATLTFWPLNRFSGVGTAPETFASVPDQTCPI